MSDMSPQETKRERGEGGRERERETVPLFYRLGKLICTFIFLVFPWSVTLFPFLIYTLVFPDLICTLVFHSKPWSKIIFENWSVPLFFQVDLYPCFSSWKAYTCKIGVQIKHQNKGTDQENLENQGYRSIFPAGKSRVQISCSKLILDQGFDGKSRVQIKS